MSLSSVPRPTGHQPEEPSIHELPGLWIGSEEISMYVAVRRSEDGVWRGRVIFGNIDADSSISTAEILWGATESEIWEAIRDLGEHHLRALYRSLTGS